MSEMLSRQIRSSQTDQFGCNRAVFWGQTSPPKQMRAVGNELMEIDSVLNEWAVLNEMQESSPGLSSFDEGFVRTMTDVLLSVPNFHTSF